MGKLIMKLSKFILKEMMKNSGLDDSIHNRGTGKSLGDALGTLGRAIRCPNVHCKFIDHFGTFDSNRVQMETAKNITKILGLEYLQFSPADNSVICKSTLEG